MGATFTFCLILHFIMYIFSKIICSHFLTYLSHPPRDDEIYGPLLFIHKQNLDKFQFSQETILSHNGLKIKNSIL